MLRRLIVSLVAAITMRKLCVTDYGGKDQKVTPALAQAEYGSTGIRLRTRKLPISLLGARTVSIRSF